MTVFVKIRQGFTAAVGEVLHIEGTLLAVTEKEFEAIAHKVEVLAEDVALVLHLTKGHALAISPALSLTDLPSLPATETAADSGAAPTTDAAPAAAEETQAAAEQHEAAEPAQTGQEPVEPAQAVQEGVQA